MCSTHPLHTNSHRRQHHPVTILFHDFVDQGVILSQVDYSNHFVGPGYYDPYPLDSHWVKKSFNIRLNSNAASSNGNANHGPPSMGVPPGVSSGSTGMNKQQRAGVKGKGALRASMDISTIEKPHASSQQPNHHHDAALSGAANGGDDAGLMDLLSLDTVHVGEHVAINKVTDRQGEATLPRCLDSISTFLLIV